MFSLQINEYVLIFCKLIEINLFFIVTYAFFGIVLVIFWFWIRDLNLFGLFFAFFLN